MKDKKKKLAVFLVSTIGLFILPVLVFANGGHPHDQGGALWSNQIMIWPVVIASIVIAISGLFSLFIGLEKESAKKAVFSLISISAVGASLFVFGATIYKNTQSATQGPVHWHADFVISKCGEKVDIKDPIGLSNKIGLPLLHEHDDERIHVEGAVRKYGDIDLSSFFEALGGEFSNNRLVVPTNEGKVVLEDGTKCPSGGEAELKFFVYKTKDGKVTLRELESPESYLLSKHSHVPPGDCVIIELTSSEGKTNEICPTYEAAIQSGEIELVK